MILPMFEPHDSLIEGEIERNVWQVNPKPGQLVMDIGANKGGVTALCALNGARVVAYEPNPIAFELLQKTLEINGVADRVQAINAAVATQTGEAKLTYNRIKNEEKRVNGRLAMLGETDDLESVVKTVSIEDAIGDKVWDIVKIDIEGFEFPLLSGCNESVFKQIKYLTMELHYTFNPGDEVYNWVINRLQKYFFVHGPITPSGKFQSVFCTAR